MKIHSHINTLIGNIFSISYDGNHIAIAGDPQNVAKVYSIPAVKTNVKNSNNNVSKLVYKCSDVITDVKWSPDSQLLLCLIQSCSIVQVWSVSDPSWRCKIDEGTLGLIDVRWSPDSRHIITTSKWNLRVTVWSLCSRVVSYIKHMKRHSASAAAPSHHHEYMDMSSCGRYLAVAERKCREDSEGTSDKTTAEYVSVFSMDQWTLYKHFPVDTEDLTGIKLSPDSTVLVVWDSIVKMSVLMYSVEGDLIGRYSANPPSPAPPGGVTSVRWSPTSQLCAVTMLNSTQVVLLNHVTCKPLLVLDPDAVVGSDTKDGVVVYREKDSTTNKQSSKPLPLGEGTEPYEVVTQRPLLPLVRQEVTSGDSQQPDGSLHSDLTQHTNLLSFSADGQFLATTHREYSGAVFVWHLTAQSACAGLAKVVTLHTAPVTALLWVPAGPLGEGVSGEAGYSTLYTMTSHTAPPTRLYTWRVGRTQSPPRTLILPTDVPSSSPQSHVCSGLQWNQNARFLLLSLRATNSSSTTAACLCHI